MDLTAFTESLLTLRLVEIRSLAADFASAVEDPADEVAYTRAVLAIEREIREVRMSVSAAVASSQASQTVIRAAERDGAELPDMDVTRVSRAAAQVARGCVAGRAVADQTAVVAAAFRRLDRVLVTS